jgi:hypothetical protein
MKVSKGLVPVVLLLVLVSWNGHAQPPAVKEGEKVWVQWRPNDWYHGTVGKKVPLGIHIEFDDGDKLNVNPSVVAVDRAPGKNAIKVGARVIAQWTDKRYYPGWVSGASDGKFDIQFDDGDSLAVDPDDIRLLAVQPKADRTPKVGDTVWAQWRPNDWYRGKVGKVTKVGLFINFDDGDTADLPVPLVARNRAPDKEAVKIGLRVLARWTDNRFYPATVTKEADGGNFNVRFDDSADLTVEPKDLRLLNE